MRLKTLAELAARCEGAVIRGNKELAITGIEHDSRKVQAGTLFVCIPGTHVDGHTFIPQAVKAGAVAILTTREDVEVPEGVAVLRVPELQTALDAMVPYFYDYPRARTARRRRATSRAPSCVARATRSASSARFRL